MKTLRFLILGLLATTVVCHAQNTQPGWFNVQSLARPPITAMDSNMESQVIANGLFTPLGQPNVPSTPIAEAITPEIQALANGLQDDPVRIFNYVHDHIRFVFYFGSKKGAQLTLLERVAMTLTNAPCSWLCFKLRVTPMHNINLAGCCFPMTFLTGVAAIFIIGSS